MSSSASSAPRKSGHVKFFNSTKGYGFIIPAEESGSPVVEVFVHHTAINGEGFKSLAEVEYDLIQGPKGMQAANVSGPGGAPVQGDPNARRPYQQQRRNGYSNKYITGDGQYPPGGYAVYGMIPGAPYGYAMYPAAAYPHPSAFGYFNATQGGQPMYAYHPPPQQQQQQPPTPHQQHQQQLQQQQQQQQQQLPTNNNAPSSPSSPSMAPMVAMYYPYPPHQPYFGPSVAPPTTGLTSTSSSSSTSNQTNNTTSRELDTTMLLAQTHQATTTAPENEEQHQPSSSSATADPPH
ncbi:hypothetical protein O0I10_010459 [Lichtheimia ornata]|uniref:CSD domain-containing protein n=1 Tax=Lichtheimia ornata TaxID=688661 RepID=A0AAD7UUV4_9FUNG|nr:uncharacterized protein O0I10_010459 [Lichtheimia ornata]KAJ8653892.1 hypothetical protein O0I10_010459 [Lichtheimia ornata]